MALGETPYLTVGQVAQRCGVSNRTVLNWIKQRGLTAHRLPSGHYRVHRDVLRAFLARQARARGEAQPAAAGELPDTCWLHASVGQHHDCNRCVVYQSQALHCFVVRARSPDAAVGCGAPCAECTYFREMYEQIGDSLQLETDACAVLRGGVVLGTNLAAQELLGHDAATLIGMRWDRLVDPAQHDAHVAVGRRFRQGIADGPSRFDSVLRGADDRPLEVAFTVSAFPRLWGALLAVFRPR